MYSDTGIFASWLFEDGAETDLFSIACRASANLLSAKTSSKELKLRSTNTFPFVSTAPHFPSFETRMYSK